MKGTLAGAVASKKVPLYAYECGICIERLCDL